jgi:hypothetical protein
LLKESRSEVKKDDQRKEGKGVSNYRTEEKRRQASKKKAMGIEAKDEIPRAPSPSLWVALIQITETSTRRRAKESEHGKDQSHKVQFLNVEQQGQVRAAKGAVGCWRIGSGYWDRNGLFRQKKWGLEMKDLTAR